MKHSIEELRKISYLMRKRFLEMFTKVGYGHVTSAFSWAEIAVSLYYELMQPSDRMVVSKGHGCGILFPIFEDLGYFSKDEMENMLLSKCNNKKLKELFYPGFDFYGGSLGIGLPMAAGLAMGDKLSNCSCKTYCLVGDAECYEGSIWEGAHFAGHNQLSNLIVIVDRNGLGVSDFTEHMNRLEPLADKWKSCGFDVCEIDGHNIKIILETLFKVANDKGERPKCIIAHTKKGKGLAYTIDNPLMHGFMPKNDKDIERAFRELEY